MKRFFLVTAVATMCASGIVLIFDVSFKVVLAVSLIISALGIVLLCLFKRKLLKTALCFSLTFILMILRVNHFKTVNLDSINGLIGKTADVRCTVIEEPKIYDNCSIYLVKTSFIDIDDAPQEIKLKLFSTDNDLPIDAFDILKCEVEFSSNLSSVYASDKSDGFFISGFANNCEIVETVKKPFYYKAIKLRKYIIDTFNDNLPESVSAIPAAMITGNKQNLSDKFYSQIKYDGMAHVLAVSGFHISIICFTLVELMRKLTLSKKLSYTVGLLSVIILAAVAGFSGSVMRAAIMYAVIVASQIFSRKGDSLNSLGLAATAILIYNPYNLFDLSFLLSGMGTLGIILIAVPITYRIDSWERKDTFPFRTLKYFLKIIVISVSATLFTMPISLYSFGFVSIIGPIVNLVLTIPIYFLMIISLLALIFSKVPYISTVLFFVVEILSKVFKTVISFFAGFKYGGFYSHDECVYILIAVAALLSVITYIFRKRRYTVRIVSLVFALCFVASVIGQSAINILKTQVYVIDSKTNPSMVLIRGEHAAVIGTGNGTSSVSEIEDILKFNYIDNIDLLLIPAIDTNSLAVIREMEDSFNIQQIALNSQIYSIYDSNNIKTPVIRLPSLNATLWGNVSISADSNNQNNSVFVRIGNESFLLDYNLSNHFETPDYILSANSEYMFEVYGNKPKYFVLGNYNDAEKTSQYLIENGAKAVSTSELGTVSAIKVKDSVLKFS